MSLGNVQYHVYLKTYAYGGSSRAPSLLFSSLGHVLYADGSSSRPFSAIEWFLQLEAHAGLRCTIGSSHLHLSGLRLEQLASALSSRLFERHCCAQRAIVACAPTLAEHASEAHCWGRSWRHRPVSIASQRWVAQMQHVGRVLLCSATVSLPWRALCCVERNCRVLFLRSVGD